MFYYKSGSIINRNGVNYVLILYKGKWIARKIKGDKNGKN